MNQFAVRLDIGFKLRVPGGQGEETQAGVGVQPELVEDGIKEVVGVGEAKFFHYGEAAVNQEVSDSVEELPLD